MSIKKTLLIIQPSLSSFGIANLCCNKYCAIRICPWDPEIVMIWQRIECIRLVILNFRLILVNNIILSARSFSCQVQIHKMYSLTYSLILSRSRFRQSDSSSWFCSYSPNSHTALPYDGSGILYQTHETKIILKQKCKHRNLINEHSFYLIRNCYLRWWSLVTVSTTNTTCGSNTHCSTWKRRTWSKPISWKHCTQQT